MRTTFVRRDLYFYTIFLQKSQSFQGLFLVVMNGCAVYYQYMNSQGFYYKLLLGALFFALCTPLFVLPNSLTFPFVTPKVFGFRLAVEMGVLVAGFMVYRNRSLGFRFDKVAIALCVLFGVSLLSGIFGVDFYHSWYSNQERMGGLFSLLHYIAFFFLCLFAFRGYEGNEEQGITFLGFRHVLLFFFGVSTVMAIIAILQRFSDSSILFAQPGGRAYATLGNPIYLGNAMAVSIFLSAYLFVKEKTARSVYLLGGLLMFGALLYSESRGALFGLVVGLLVSVLCYFFWSFRKARKKIVAGLLLTGVVVSIIFVSPLQHELQKTSIGRIVTFSQDVGPRLIAWRIAVDALQSRPLLGYGYDTFHHVFNERFNPQSTEYSFYETWFDNAHNSVLNILATMGIIGFGAYVYLYAVLVITVRRKVVGEIYSPLEGSLLIAVFAADFFAKIFVFDHHVSLLSIMIFCAYVAQRDAAVLTPRFRKWHAVILGGVVVLYGMVYCNIIPARINSQVVAMMKNKYSDPESVVMFIDTLLSSSSPYYKDVVIDVSRHLQEVYPSLRFSEDRKQRLVQQVIVALERAHVQQPRELQPLLEETSLYLLLPHDTAHYDTLMGIYQTLQLLSPARQQTYYLKAKAQVVYGNVDAALRTVDEAIAINPKVMYSFAFRSYLKESKGDSVGAAEDLLFALDHGFVPNNYEEQTRVAAQLRSLHLASFIYSQNIVYRLYPQFRLAVPDSELALLASDYEQIGMYSAAQLTRAKMSVADTKKYTPDTPVLAVRMAQQYIDRGLKIPNNLVLLLVAVGVPSTDTSRFIAHAERPDLITKDLPMFTQCFEGKTNYERLSICLL